MSEISLINSFQESEQTHAVYEISFGSEIYRHSFYRGEAVTLSVGTTRPGGGGASGGGAGAGCRGAREGGGGAGGGGGWRRGGAGADVQIFDSTTAPENETSRT